MTDVMEQDSKDVEDIPNLFEYLLPESRVLGVCQHFNLSFNRKVFNGWVKQPSPCCGAAGVAGAWNALFDMHRLDARSLNHTHILRIYAGIFSGMIERKMKSFERKLGCEYLSRLAQPPLPSPQLAQLPRPSGSQPDSPSQTSASSKAASTGSASDVAGQMISTAPTATASSFTLQEFIHRLNHQLWADHGRKIGGKQETAPTKASVLKVMRKMARERVRYKFVELKKRGLTADQAVAFLASVGAPTAESGACNREGGNWGMTAEADPNTEAAVNAMKAGGTGSQQQQTPGYLVEARGFAEGGGGGDIERCGDLGPVLNFPRTVEDCFVELFELEGVSFLPKTPQQRGQQGRSEDGSSRPAASDLTLDQDLDLDSNGCNDSDSGSEGGDVDGLLDGGGDSDLSDGAGEPCRVAHKPTKGTAKARRKSGTSIVPVTCNLQSASTPFTIGEDRPTKNSGRIATNSSNSIKNSSRFGKTTADSGGNAWNWRKDLLGIIKNMSGLHKVCSPDQPSTAAIGNWGILDVVPKIAEFYENSDSNFPCFWPAEHPMLPVPRATARLFMGKKLTKMSKVEVPLSRKDTEETITQQWDALKNAFSHENEVLLFHLKNHYALIFAMREWSVPAAAAVAAAPSSSSAPMLTKKKQNEKQKEKVEKEKGEKLPQDLELPNIPQSSQSLHHHQKQQQQQQQQPAGVAGLMGTAIEGRAAASAADPCRGPTHLHVSGAENCSADCSGAMQHLGDSSSSTIGSSRKKVRVRQLLTARRGQRPGAWIDFSEVRETMLGWEGYKIIAISTPLDT